jgi:hypothetical protein
MFEQFITHPVVQKTITRLKALAWHAAMMAAAIIVSVLIENLSSFDIPGWASVAAGLVLAQLSKAINNELSRGPVVI